MTAADRAPADSDGSAPAPPLRWRMDLSYDGTDFSGWAVQPGRRTVQGTLESAVAMVLRLTTPTTLQCAGRTDAGVHARGQVAHLDLPAAALDDGATLRRRLGRVLSSDIVIRGVQRAPVGFDARFSAVWRRYVYRLTDTTAPPDPLLRSMVAAVRRPVDLDVFNTAARELLGLHDFAAFCRRKAGATTVRTLLRCEAVRVTDGQFRGVVEITVVADAFCHSMVRSLVGGIVSVATGQRSAGWLREVATARQRVSTVEVMAAAGLTLEEVGYPEPAQLAARAETARSMREPV